MKVLILSISAGGGHIHAARAIETYTTMNDPSSEVRMIDTLKYINPLIDKVVIGSYLKSIKVSPSIFGKLYNVRDSDDVFANVSNKFNELMALKIFPLINEFAPDIIVSTHFFTTEMLSILKVKNKITIPCVCLLTDYSSHNAWIHPQIDAYVVSNSDMIGEMQEKGVDPSIIYDLGIPVKPDFLEKYSRDETLTSLELSTDKLTILIMGGTLGLGKIRNLYEELKRVERDFQMIVITGSNKKLYSELIKLKATSTKETKVIGFTDEVNKYMQACDLLLTKPGGLTITEALVCSTPLGLFSPIPGQEEKNSQFLLRHNLAVTIGNVKNCKESIEDLISNTIKLKEMSATSKYFSKPNAGNDIYNLMNELINKKGLSQSRK